MRWMMWIVVLEMVFCYIGIKVWVELYVMDIFGMVS
jgi:hypothetical protein